tara:strand:+ start:28 stop:666 length:639 start_codon:yes stop_codon:yes gene_type:complete
MTKVDLIKMAQSKLVAIRKAGKALLSGEKKWREVIDSVASDITMHGYQVIDKVALDLISAWQTIDAVKGKKRNTKGVKSAREAIYIHFCPEYATIGKGQTSESMTFRKDIDALIQIVINKVTALECQPVFNTTDKKPPVATPRAIVNKVIGKTVTTRKPRTPETKVVRFNQKESVKEIRISQKITEYKHDEELCKLLSELLNIKIAERKNQA